MALIVRAGLLAGLAISSIPAVVAAQEISSDSLLLRIDLLERRITDLERLVREMQALIRNEPSRVRSDAGSSQWRDLQNWRRLQRGMTMDQVRALLGEPGRVDAQFAWTYWYWSDDRGGANVYFGTRSSRVEGWSEPRR
jgi:hypothetical protein